MSSAKHPVIVRPVSRFRLKPLARALSGFAGLVPVMAWAQLPSGGQVVAGDAAINQTDANHLVVQQGSAKAILHWQQFSIGEQGYVQFIQPGASAIALNRVVGADPSAILGQLSANGQIFLINPNGIVFGQGARVDVAGIVATTMDIDDDDFLKGDYRFKDSAHKVEGASVVNAGSIDAAAGGYVVLAGDYVDNQGVIQARAGTAMLASGKALTLQLSGSELVDFAVDEATVVQLAGVKNAGQIIANGGRVIMTAKVANDLAATVVNNEGLVQAQSTVEKDGVVYLLGEGGSVANAGTIDASAQAGADGGHVEIRASGDIVHAAGSHTTVSGAATGTSNAGSVYTWADGTNRYEKGAHIEARGGAEGGNGGAVELSGENVAMREVVDLRAAHGELGTLSLDPNYIYISTDGTDTGASFGTPDALVEEAVLENQLKVGNVQHTADGINARIEIGTLGDGVLDGTNGGAGGSLTLLASGSGSPSISMNTNDTIRVDRAIGIRVDDGDVPIGSMTLGHLEAGTSITLDAGTISASSLKINKNINTATDNSYNITARAATGDLTVNGDVSINVKNDSAGGLASTVLLRATNGSVTVTGDVVSKVEGKGYYHYNWETPDGDAQTYFGAQPWSLISQGDHAIDAKLTIEAGNDVTIGGDVDVQALDRNTSFINSGGYFQTATTTHHNFWTATAADALATITAGGDVSIGGMTTVIADGYATASYGETETFDTMVDNHNYTTNNQTVYTNFQCIEGEGCGYQSSYNYQRTDVKGSFAGNYIWVFGTYVYPMPAVAYNSPSYSTGSDSNTQTQAGPLAYSGKAGLTATLDIDAGGDVVLNGIDNRVINHSVSGSGSYNDVNWGAQDTAGAGNNISGSRERRYHDQFTNTYTVAPATASTSVNAGDNASVQLNGPGYTVSAEHTAITASNNNIAHASMTVSAGVNGGATGAGTVTIAAPISVSGASSNEVGLTVTNLDGAIVNPGNAGALSVTNYYSGGNARAKFDGAGQVQLGTLAVTSGTGATANLDLDADDELQVAQASVTGYTANLTSNSGAATTMGPVTVTAGQNATMNSTSGGTMDFDDVTVNAGNFATLTATADDQMTIAGNFTATGTRSANVTAASENSGVHVASAGSIEATSMGFGPSGTAAINVQGAGPVLLEGDVLATARSTASNTIGSSNQITLGTDALARATSTEASATVTMSATSGMQLDGDVVAQSSLGGATANLTTSGGSNAALSQGSASSVNVNGVSAALNVQAGSSGSIDATNAAQFNLAGSLASASTSGQSTLTVSGAGGQVNNPSATSSSNLAYMAITTYGAAGTLQLTGNGTVTGNTNNVTGAELLVSAAGAIDADQFAVQVINNSFGGSAGARATLASDNGGIDLGAVTATTNGNGPVTIKATASGNLNASGALASTSNNGAATVELASTAGLTHTTGTIDASALNGSATVVVAGASGLTVDADVTAQSSNAAVMTLSSNTGAVTVANGVDATVTAPNLAALTVNGAGGVNFAGAGHVTASIGDATAQFSGGSDMYIAAMTVNSGNSALLSADSDGGLNLGSASLTSSSGSSNTTLSAENDVLISGAVNATALSGGATVQVGSNTGNAQVGVGGSLSAVAGPQAAAVTLTADNALTINGDISAQSNTASTIGLSTNSGDITVAGGVDVSVSGNMVAALAVSGGADVDFLGTAQVTSSNGDAVAQLGASGVLTANHVIVSGDTLVSLEANALGGINFAAGQVTSDSGAVNVHLESDGDVELTGALAATASNGQVTVEVTSNAGTVHLGSTGSIDAVAGSQTATVALGALGNVVVDGAIDAQSNTAAAVTLASSSGAVTVADGVDVKASGLYLAALAVSGATGVDFAGNGAATSAAGDTSVEMSSVGSVAMSGDVVLNGASTSVLTLSAPTLNFSGTGAVNGSNATAQLIGSGDVTVDGVLAANAGSGQAQLTVTSGDVFTLGSAGDLKSASANSNANVNMSATNGVQIDGVVLAQAPAGMAIVTLDTTGGSSAAVGQGADSTIKADGAIAVVAVKAGNNNAVDSSNAAALNLAGALSAIASDGSAELVVEGAGGTVHDFTAQANGGYASASFTSHDADGTLVFDGAGGVTGDYDTHIGATLTVTAAGALNSQQASLAAVNANGNSLAGASVNLSAQDHNQIGNVTVASNGGGNADLDATGATVTAAGTLTANAGHGSALLDVAATGLLDIDGSVNASSNAGNVMMTLTGASIVHDGALDASATHANALITLVSTGAVTLNGSAAVGALEEAKLAVQGSDITVASAATLLADGANVRGNVNLLAVDSLVIDGAITANSANGTALIELFTDGGPAADIVQHAGSVITADGAFAAVDVRAGTSLLVDPDQLAEADLHTVNVNATTGDAAFDVEGSTVTLHDFDVTALQGNAEVTINAHDAAGTLTLNGNGSVHGNMFEGNGARLRLDAAGALDTSAATLRVDNDSTNPDAEALAYFTADGSSHIGQLTIESGASASLLATAGTGLIVHDIDISGATAGAKLSTVTGDVALGDMTLAGTNGANINATATAGNLYQQDGTSLQVDSAQNMARITLKADDTMTLRDIALSGASAKLTADTQGALNLVAGTLQQTDSVGTSTVQFTAAGPITIASDVALNSNAGHSTLTVLSGDGSAINQSADSLVSVGGQSAAAWVQAGESQDTAFALSGDIQMQAGNGDAELTVVGGSGSVHNFNIASSGGAASAEILSGGDLLLTGSGVVSGHSDTVVGAALTVTADGALEQLGTLAVSNSSTGASAGAAAKLTSAGDLTSSADISVDIDGGGVATLALRSGADMLIEHDLLATAHNLGDGLGGAAIQLTTGNDDEEVDTSIEQSSDSEIHALSEGNDAGNASVLVQAGDCCDAEVKLLGKTTAEVDSGLGNASVTVRSGNVVVQDVSAKVNTDGDGDSLIDLAAPVALTVNGVLTAQAADAQAEAGIKLITDSLNYAGGASLSNGNSYVQLAPFNTTWLIGVESEPDFDSTPAVNYSMALMQKFVGNNAELRFGGKYDRSPWVNGDDEVCVPGMDGWADIGQHTGDIHVAGGGNSHLQLVATSMVFDTTGTTYYHDNQMSPWSVPSGRVAIYVPRPTPSLDRYLDRTDNSLQQSITGLESALNTPLYAAATVVAPEGTVQIAGDMFMAGDGVNMSKVMFDGSPVSGGSSDGGVSGGGSNFSEQTPVGGGSSSIGSDNQSAGGENQAVGGDSQSEGAGSSSSTEEELSNDDEDENGKKRSKTR